MDDYESNGNKEMVKIVLKVYMMRLMVSSFSLFGFDLEYSYDSIISFDFDVDFNLLLDYYECILFCLSCFPYGIVLC